MNKQTQIFNFECLFFMLYHLIRKFGIVFFRGGGWFLVQGVFFSVLLEALGILGGGWFCLHLIIPETWNPKTPPPHGVPRQWLWQTSERKTPCRDPWSYQFSILKKCQENLDCLTFEMLFPVGTVHPRMQTETEAQSDSIDSRLSLCLNWTHVINSEH